MKNASYITKDPNSINSTPLSEKAIRDYVGSGAQNFESDVIQSIKVFDSLPSTNSYLLEQPLKIGEAKICLAEAQLSGRGRRGNNWQSAANKNIMLSMSWVFDGWPETITGLGLAAGLVVAERLNQDYKIDVGIKWPNDLLIKDEKLAGILVDVTGDINKGCNVVIGVGLNVHQPDWSKHSEGCSDGSDYAWTDLDSQGVTVDRNILAASIIGDWLEMLALFEMKGFGAFVGRWNKNSCHINKHVTLFDGGADSVLSGKMQGVNDAGELLILDSESNQHVISNSNLSLRLAN